MRYALDTGAGIYHAVGASAMGPDASDVVDPQLRVRGVTGLRVVDASVLPVQVAGNTQAPAMAAVAWIAARQFHPRRLITEVVTMSGNVTSDPLAEAKAEGGYPGGAGVPAGSGLRDRARLDV